MKFTALFGVLATLLPTALAFPAYLKDPEKMAEMQKRFEEHKAAQPAGEKRLISQLYPPVIPGYKIIPDADHPFQAPGPNDIRGPCPGLNTMANHGYLSRNGITSSQELAWAMQESFALDPQLAEFLGFLATSVDGNVLTDKVTIGGSSSQVSSAPNGIGRHNAYEIDSSLTRDDKALGNNFVLNGTLYEQMFQVADQVNNGVMNIQSQAVFRNLRYKDSQARNPSFQFVPIGVLFFGADHFPWRVFPSANKDGTIQPATRQSIASIYGAQDQGDGHTWAYVPERFPDDWARSPIPYTLEEIVGHAVLSLTYAAANGPALPIGFDPSKASDPSYVGCQIFKAATAQIPTTLLGLPFIGQGLQAAQSAFSQFNCS